MNEHLQRLETLSRHPSLQVSPEQRPAIVANILHHLMYPYFLSRRPEMREKFDELQYQTFMRALADYCLRGYIESHEPRMTIEFIRGLHRQFYSNEPRAPIIAVDGSMTTMVPGEFKTVPVIMPWGGEWVVIPAPENVQADLDGLLNALHDKGLPLFQRYIQSMFDFTRIHPFRDSNGKMAPVLGDLYLLKQGLHPPYFAKYRSDKKALYSRSERYATDPTRDITDLYLVVLNLYEECGLDFGVGRLSGKNDTDA